MRPPPRGHCHTAAEQDSGWTDSGEWGGAIRSSCRASGNKILRRRLARKLKKRMRTKPCGSTWRRKRRSSSSPVTVMSFCFAATCIILPAKSNLAIGEGNNPMIGDGDPMGVSGQIMKDVLRTSERRLRVHDPILTEQRTKQGTERPFLRQWLKTAWESELSFPKSSLQPCGELATKNTAEHLHG